MNRRNMPTWQQVLLAVLENVPEHKNGADAWQRLNAAEQSAVMDYLTTHCGDDAQVGLEETCARVKHTKWWVVIWTVLGVCACAVAFVDLLIWLELQTSIEFTDCAWLLLCPLNMFSAWQGNADGKAQGVWRKHVATFEGTTHALNDMHCLFTLPRAERINKGHFVFWLAMWLVWIALLLRKWMKG